MTATMENGVKLHVHWLNATRPHLVKVQGECTFSDTLAEFFGGIENAKHARDIDRKCTIPQSDWQRGVSAAYNRVFHDLHLSLKEQEVARFMVEFS